MSNDTLLNPWKSLCRCVCVKEETILISASAANVSQVNKYQLGKFPHLTSLILMYAEVRIGSTAGRSKYHKLILIGLKRPQSSITERYWFA